jgi:hypothetical protein
LREDLGFNQNTEGNSCIEIKESFSGYPIEQSQEFSIIFCTRQGEGMESTFHLASLKWSQAAWTENWLQLPEKSGVIERLGSGKKCIDKWFQIWSKTSEKGTSRSVFGAFCDSIQSGEDRYTGGAPQLVGIYRRDSAESFGVIFKSKRNLLGVPVEASTKCGNVEWRNSLFERCDWQTMTVLEDAQKHKRPKGLGKALK